MFMHSVILHQRNATVRLILITLLIMIRYSRTNAECKPLPPLAVIPLNYCKEEIYKIDVARRYCGRRLAMKLADICRHRYLKLVAEKGDRYQGPRRQGIVDDCCYNSCYESTMLLYCEY